MSKIELTPLAKRKYRAAKAALKASMIYLANAINDEKALADALASLKSYILRRDVCGLTTKNYNRFFVGTVQWLRKAEGDIAANLREYLSGRTSDIDRWPDDAEFRNGWLGRDQYKNARQPRLRLIFEGIEQRKRTLLNEDIEIRSALTIEHIMPQSWRDNWPVLIVPSEPQIIEGPDPEILRSMCINKMGNLTLLTHSLNASVSNGPFNVKLPAVRAHSSLALNRELGAYQSWDEEAVVERGLALFEVARSVWGAPERPEGIVPAGSSSGVAYATALPPIGTECSFRYADKTWNSVVVEGGMRIEGLDGMASTFSAASRMVTGTSRNGWMDWRLRLPGTTADLLADDWRQKSPAA